MKIHLFQKSLKSEDVVFESKSPPLSHSKISEVEILLQTSINQELRGLSAHSTQRKGFLPGTSRMSEFFILPQISYC